MRVFLTAPNLHPESTGEEHVAWQWARALSEVVDLTVLAFQREGRTPLAQTLPRARVETRPMPRFGERHARFAAMAKPGYPIYMRAVRRFLADNPGAFDIAHQIMPQAARYPIPLRGTGLPYVVGPLGGALETPEAFRAEERTAKWYTRLRAVDGLRFRHDPWLRASYAEADLVLGVAPYMRDVLGAIALKRFAPVLELGVEDLPPLPDRAAGNAAEGGAEGGADGRDPARPVQLLHVGRGVRTKGLRDVVRALGHLKDDLPGLRLTSAGTGEEIDICRAEADRLGVADRVRFLGQLPRAEVEDLYRRADIFAFPSFREPAGNVVYEAMRWGLPVVAAARGGPDWIVDDATGIRVPVTDPDRYARDVAAALRRLAEDPALRRRMGEAARDKLRREGFWPDKARALAGLYREVLEAPAGD